MTDTTEALLQRLRGGCNINTNAGAGPASLPSEESNMIDIDDLTIGEAKRLAAMLAPLLGQKAPPTTENPTGDQAPYAAVIGRRCIIRARDAGVHYGIVRSIHGRVVVVDKDRRIWRWRGALTLSDLALTGPVETDGFSRISPEVEQVVISDACEVLTCTQACIDRIAEVSPWTM